MGTENLDKLLKALNGFQFQIISNTSHLVQIDGGYSIEVEKNDIYKLLHENQVVAPFNDLEELCEFIKMDMVLNE